MSEKNKNQEVQLNEDLFAEIKPGIYHHFKGSDYKVICEAHDHDSQEAIVVYAPVEGGNCWTRSKADFLAEVEVDGKKKKRFEFLREEEQNSWENKYLRALADYQNLLKQSTKDREEFVKYALDDFLQNILPIYDHLKLSVAGLSEEEGKNAWAQGVRHVLKQFSEVLSQHGIEEIKTVGEKFDHNTMEAIDGSGETVKQEVMPGYKLNGKLIRPAKVIVE
ncbi:nucleotide exchange factor GrpE [Candidatus Falkowbacteria bacterium]|uniref:Protein GrpE n=1 Tax=Candidatus Falkowbacteria bacterium CG10_big_fil_rev_8_21_14_0_10_37_18 TaxID=1974562 RepID=A0A2H0VB78_9BACT|nr:nucleotide exchange factor GrpE [Candidatus Falkowbacteria bacterium]NCQ12751.1 nucleotide exchange factor GrpE [Candidatus Falkowbacteria bacterium]OIO05388.1 MAG: nucleotide exchange factor GrpE [Candidatus Falkowbacteria bacterium CG1_02_37_21]PIR95619.1 MAG: nucleotide exchange factor GrpE [Candidatus Falkowbacteria bacterium CG10_big_fil_rev_8_21_14_0_10_37_18]